jgi:hypothetical protein
MPFSSCLALARQGIQDCWRKAQGAMQPMKRDAPSPDVVRVLAETGEEICRWSVRDEQRNG